MKRNRKPNTKCKICGKEFYARPSHLKKGWGKKYCSQECKYKSQRKGKYVHCKVCGKKIWRRPRDLTGSKSGNFFCSKSHQAIWRNKYYSGPKHSQWTGGTGAYKRRLLKSNKPLVCAKCGCDDERVLVAHHKDKNREHNNVENLEWLCRNCHYLVHNGQSSE